MMDLKIEKSQNLKPLFTDESKLGFGNIFTDHMLIMNYDEGKGWHSARIVPYAPLPLDPAAMVLHYAQEVFEGMKAYRTKDGSVQLFRPDENFKRLNMSNERLCIPEIDVQFCVDSLKELVKVDERWVPKSDGCSLYIRPFIFASDANLGVRAGNSYLYVVIMSPVGSYYASGLDPVKIYVEENFVRAVKGGTGAAKTGGNYASAIKAQNIAKKEGFAQVLWLDGIERKYIEEVGTMNVFFSIGDEIITPALGGSILPGITRKSSIEILKSWGLNVVERKISLEEIEKAYDDGSLKEMFGTGTAAVISPVGVLRANGREMVLNGGKIGEVSQRLYDQLTGIQWGSVEDTYGWVVKVV